MRWFEQAISKPRYHLMQFHRPAMLKLERLCKREYSVRVKVHALARFLFYQEPELSGEILADQAQLYAGS